MDDEGDYNLSFIDMLLSMLAAMTVFFVVSFIQMSHNKMDVGNVKTDAQYIVIVNWNPDLDCDVDTYVMDPAGNIAWYGNHDVGLGHLDHDAMGWSYDRVVIDDRSIVVKANQEIWTMRGVIPGTYRVNVHLYQCSDHQWTPGTPIPVDIKITKLNPTVINVAVGTVDLHRVWEEGMGFSWVVDSQGDFSRVQTNDVPLVPKVQRKKT